ncbi:putative feruloyl esterase [Arabidopsis thaliana]
MINERSCGCPTLSFSTHALPLRRPKFPATNKVKKLRMDSSQGSTQQKIVILNSHNENLVGLLHETGSTEIVVLCHGFRSNKLCFFVVWEYLFCTQRKWSPHDIVGLQMLVGVIACINFVLSLAYECIQNFEIMKNVAVAIEREGISAFRFDFSGNGESEGSFYYGNYNYEADDLHSVIQYFSNLNRVVTIILGHSKGGDVVLLYASKYHDIPNVINLSGRYDLKKGIGERLGEDFLERIKQQGYIDVKDGIVITLRFSCTVIRTLVLLSMYWFVTGDSGYRVTEESLMDRLNTDMHEACLKIDKECRVLTVHGSGDETVPVEDAKEFAKIIPNHELQIVEGADHCYTNYQSQLVLTVMEFIKSHCEEKNDKTCN